MFLGAFGGVFCGWWHVLCQVGRCGRFCVRLMGCHNVSCVLWCCILFVDLKLYKYIFIVFV